MADKKITELTPLSSAATADVFPIVEVSGPETKKITLADLMGSPGPIGASVPSTAVFTDAEAAILTLDYGTSINEISIDGTLAGNSDDAAPTEKAVKTYVDNYIAQENVRRISTDSTAVVGDVILVDTTAGDVNIDIDISTNGRVSIKKITSDSNDVIITASSGTIDGVGQKTLDTPNQAFTFLIDTDDVYIF
jgi:hypothetical protein